MFSNFEEKGKIYTQVISKEPVQVWIQTTTHRILGKIHIRPEDRVKDELDRAVAFLAVTDATVYDPASNRVLMQTKFLAVSINNIVWVLPDADRISGAEGES